MSLKSLFLILKGGPGSGNHGHFGRPGKIGGSSSSKLAGGLPANPSSLEYSNYRLIQDEVDIDSLSKPVYFRMSDLPPVGKDKVRV